MLKRLYYCFHYLKFLIDPAGSKNRKFSNLRSYSLADLKQNRVFEPDLLLLCRYIRRGDVCFDVGANQGEYTYIMESLAGPENVYAFEPITELRALLRILFKNVKVYGLALSWQNEWCDFKIPKVSKSLLFSRAKLDTEFKEFGEIGSQIFKVQCITLDTFVSKFNVERLSFLKIDVEGHEYEVLKGGAEVIMRFKPIMLIEIEQRHHAFKIDEIFDFINGLSYDIYFYSFYLNSLEKLSNFNVEIHQSESKSKTIDYINNFWCFPQDRNIC